MMKKIVLSVVSIMMTSVLSFHLVSCKNDNDDMNEKPQVDVDEALLARILQDSVIQAVDLGLSVKWANMNLGAHKTLDFGDYYAWGETSPKESYELSNYKWYSGSDIYMSKYCTERVDVEDGNFITLELSDDAAYVNWGTTWRMPTNDEFIELNSNCTWKWIESNGVNGYVVIGPNGNGIFLPLAGYRNLEKHFDAGNYGYYWSSSINPSNALNGRCFLYNRQHTLVNGTYRYFGLSIRPVTKE